MLDTLAEQQQRADLLRHGLVGRASPGRPAPDRRRRPRDRQPWPLHLRSDAGYRRSRCVPTSSAPTPRSAPSPGAPRDRCGARRPATATHACARIAADLGYRPILWTVDSGDWTRERPPESVFSHDRQRRPQRRHHRAPLRQPDHRSRRTAQVLSAAIDYLRARGLSPGDDQRAGGGRVRHRLSAGCGPVGTCDDPTAGGPWGRREIDRRAAI